MFKIGDRLITNDGEWATVLGFTKPFLNDIAIILRFDELSDELIILPIKFIQFYLNKGILSKVGSFSKDDE